MYRLEFSELSLEIKRAICDFGSKLGSETEKEVIPVKDLGRMRLHIVQGPRQACQYLYMQLLCSAVQVQFLHWLHAVKPPCSTTSGWS